MGLFEIHLGQPRTVLHPVQRAMAEQALKREEVAAAPQVGDGKGLPETRRLSVLDVSRNAQTTDEVQERFPRETPQVGAEQGCPLIGHVVAGHQIAPDRTPDLSPAWSNHTHSSGR